MPRSVGCESLPRQAEPPWLTWVRERQHDRTKPAGPIEQLRAAGCDRIFMETASGARSDRKQLRRALQALRESDELVVTRRARSVIT
ncbi:MAG: recombinase family protein [Pseudolabrys sp.]|nr:recombinase family protein [Pseudolabrys sp.]